MLELCHVPGWSPSPTVALQITKNAVRLKEFFVDADRLRKGFVSRAKFRTGLDMAGVQLDEIAYRTLEAEFDYPAVAGVPRPPPQALIND